jgi:hypothetical protein
MKRYSIEPHMNDHGDSLSASLLAEESPGGEWVLHEDAISEGREEAIGLRQELNKALNRIGELEDRAQFNPYQLEMIAEACGEKASRASVEQIVETWGDLAGAAMVLANRARSMAEGVDHE